MVKKKLRQTKCLLIKVLRIKDSEHRVALGFSVGAIVNFIPSFGFGPVVSTALAKMVKGNSISGLMGGISFLWAFPFLFYLNVVVGHLFFPLDISESEVLDHAEGAIEASIQLGKAFFAGMVTNVLFFGLALYLISFQMMKKKRKNLLSFVLRRWIIHKE